MLKKEVSICDLVPNMRIAGNGIKRFWLCNYYGKYSIR